MKKHPRISETEWEVMKVIWARGASPAEAVIAELQQQDPTWHPKTAKTLLNRLMKKQALGITREGRAYIYHPLVTEAESVDVASRSFLDRLFGGSLKPMLAHFLERKRVTPREVQELRRLLDRETRSRR
jgi:BlaI family transcriptional regulator, penicillinase repressor